MLKSGREYLLGYLAWYKSAQSAYYGGILVTNDKGVPREFRHTSGITPLPVQSILYGDSLEVSIGSDAIAPALIGALQQKPDILLINTQGRKLFGRFVSEHPPAALIELLDDPEKALPYSLYDGGDLLTALSLKHPGSSSEHLFAYLLDDNDENGYICLNQAHNTMNLYSPFQRIHDVLNLIDKKGAGLG
jgi:hypothetical protein